MEICPYCGTRHPVASVIGADGSESGPPRCHECGGVLDDLSMKATQIAMGPWFFRLPGKPFGPGCDIGVLRRMLVAGKLKPESPVRGPATHQLWRRVKYVPGIAHLAGVCHNCGTGVKHDNKFCPSCGTKFEVPDARNTLGLPATPPNDEVAKFRVIDGAMCPVCGYDKATGEECPECESIFSPADEATPVSLGPWFVHGKARAFKPGIGIDQLKKEIALGGVTGRTVLRGPTTSQFWVEAKSAPGIANLLGVCHACSAKVEPGAASCSACGVAFPSPGDDNTLGLKYPTVADTTAAQKELDDALAALGPAAFAPAAPKAVAARPVATPASQLIEAAEDEGAATVDEMELEAREHMSATAQPSARHAGHDHDHEHDHDHDHSHVHAGADAGGFDAGEARSARRVPQKQSNSLLLTALIVLPVLVIGGYLVISNLPSRPPAGKDGEKDKSADSSVKHKATASDQLVKLKKDTEARWAAVTQGQQRTTKLGPLMDQGTTLLAKANELFAAEDFLAADAELRRVLPVADEIEKVVKGRGIADDARTRATETRKQTEAAEAPKHAKDLWDKAEATFASAEEALKQEDVTKASDLWETSIQEYGKAQRFMQGMREAADARTQIEAEGTKKYPRDVLDAHNIPAWQAFQGKLKGGDEAAAAKDFLTAKSLYDQARLMIPSVEFAMQLEIGRIWYAFQTGRLTYRILHDKGAGHHPDEGRLAELKLAYENMQINRDFFNRIPKSPRCTFKELYEVILIDCAKEIESAFEAEGAAYKKAFAAGVHLTIVEKLLRIDVGKISTATKQDLDLYLKKDLPEDIKTAGFDPELLAFLKDLDETLATEQGIPVKTREKLDAMLARLDKFETGLPLMKPKK